MIKPYIFPIIFHVELNESSVYLIESKKERKKRINFEKVCWNKIAKEMVSL